MYYVQKLIDWVKNQFFSKELELSVVGLQNAGKSTLINSVQMGQFDEDVIPTVGVNIRSVKKGKVSMKIWDLGGQRRYRESWEKYCASSDCIVFVVDAASDLDTFNQARHQLEKLLEWESVEGIPLLVLGNKNDIPGSVGEKEIIERMNLKSITDRKVGCYTISAKNMVNIDVALKWLTNLSKIHK